MKFKKNKFIGKIVLPKLEQISHSKWNLTSFNNVFPKLYCIKKSTLTNVFIY